MRNYDQEQQNLLDKYNEQREKLDIERDVSLLLNSVGIHNPSSICAFDKTSPVWVALDVGTLREAVDLFTEVLSPLLVPTVFLRNQYSYISPLRSIPTKEQIKPLACIEIASPYIVVQKSLKRPTKASLVGFIEKDGLLVRIEARLPASPWRVEEVYEPCWTRAKQHEGKKMTGFSMPSIGNAISQKWKTHSLKSVEYRFVFRTLDDFHEGLQELLTA